ncbi:thioredoxin domain-containing protein [Saccharopolyspora sp. HNM0983]|uniref:Thioredoxin domain-containing protein n=1 Tax=Saccharopolyspora montiporae TaxID=2781240 RepID=A0A929G038_9PSEU|nr:thioredoxin domain-containing protein [Saccharopolyspora sp. HNM0983]MBE9373208.1 thioredoxin domain-containing protein [Saccharopolyspora sp. HNM0983]
MPKNTNPVTQKSGTSINLLLTAIVVVVAVVVIGGVLLFNRGGGGGEGGVSPELLRNPDSNVLVEAPDDKVTVVEFLDYQCPSCQQYYEGVTKQIEADYEGRINFVTRNFPLEMHPLAQPAAKAAEAAALQGKYKEMYHAIYDNWQEWAVAPGGQDYARDPAKATQQFAGYAEGIGLDMQRYAQDVDSEQVQSRIDRDMQDGQQAGVSGTPTIFVNGEQFNSTGQDLNQVNQELRGKIDEELQK